MSHDLTLDRHLTASPAQVWRCWTEAPLLMRWFTPKPVETTRAEIDPVPGGRFVTVMRIPGHGDIEGSGCILVAEPGRRLVWTNSLTEGFRPAALGDGPTDFAFTADIRMEPVGTGCRYLATVLHQNEADARTHAGMGFEEGWGAATRQLDALAQTL